MRDVDKTLPQQLQASSFQNVSSMEKVPSLPDDQSSVTIEFLRARLLAQRSASKAANHQRARQFALKLEQSAEAEASLCQKLEEGRLEVVSKHKGELMEDFGHLIVDKVSRDDSMAPKKESIAQFEASLSGDPGSFASTETISAREGVQDECGKDAGHVNIDQPSVESGILAWASRRGTQRRQLRESAHSLAHLKKIFRPSSNGSLSPDSDSSCKPWIGKSVRQIRPTTRNFKPDLQSISVKHNPVKEFLHFDKEKDEGDRMDQFELDEKFQAEKGTQGFFEELQGQVCLEGDLKKHKMTSISRPACDEGGKVSAAFKKQVDEAESQQGEMRSVQLIDPVKLDDQKVNGITNGSYDKTVCLLIEKADGNSKSNAIALNANVAQKRTVGIPAKSVPRKKSYDLMSEAKKETENGVVSSDIVPKVSSSTSADATSLERPVSDLQEGNFGGDKAYSNMHIPAGFHFPSSSLSSSQGSSSALDGPYQKRIGHQGFSEGSSNESIESVFNSECHSFAKSQSVTTDNEMPLKSGLHKENVRRFPYGSTCNETSMLDSSKGLKNSSWDEIFKRRIKAEEAKRLEGHKNSAQDNWSNSDDNFQKDSMHHPFFDGKHKTSGDLSWTSDYGQYFSLYEEDSHLGNTIRKSQDASLDRVNKVLIALQVAKHQLKNTEKYAVDKFRNSSEALIYSSTYYPLHNSTTIQMEPFLYEMEDKYGGTYMPRTFLSTEYACEKGAPIPGIAAWSRNFNGHAL